MIWMAAALAQTAAASDGPAQCLALDTPLALGPVHAGLLDGDLGRGRRVCPRDELGVTASGLLTADPANFYGHIVGGLSVEGSKLVGDRLEIFGALELVRFETVIGPLSSSYLGAGHTAIGASWLVVDPRPGDSPRTPSLAVNSKLVLPTAAGLYRNSWPFGWDVGLAGHHGLSKKLSGHWQVSGLFSAAAGKGPAQPRLGLMGTGGLAFAPAPGIAFVVDALAGLAYTANVDVLGLAPAVRFGRGRWGMELGATVPLAGRERALAVVDLRNSVRF